MKSRLTVQEKFLPFRPSYSYLSGTHSFPMTPQRIIHLCLIGFFALAIFYVKAKWQSEAWQANPLYTLLAIIALAVCAGIVFVVVILPMNG